MLLEHRHPPLASRGARGVQGTAPSPCRWLSPQKRLGSKREVESSAGGDNIPGVMLAAGSELLLHTGRASFAVLLSPGRRCWISPWGAEPEEPPRQWGCCRAGGTAPLSSPDPQIPTSKACSFCWEGFTGREANPCPSTSPFRQLPPPSRQ